MGWGPTKVGFEIEVGRNLSAYQLYRDDEIR